MKTNTTRSWAITGGISGTLAVLAYFTAAFAPLPDPVALTLALLFGPLVSVASIGLGRVLETETQHVLPRIAGWLGAGAGATVLIMLAVQQSLFSSYERIAASDPSRAALLEVGNAVHLGIDIAWDVLIAASITLSALAMWRVRGFGKVLSTIGMASGIALFVLNIATFPVPPGEDGLLDVGPICALWMLAVYVRLWWVGKKMA